MPTSTTNILYKTNKEKQLGDRELIVPSGGVLGGGSSTNLMMYSRAQRSDFDSWQMPGWSAEEMLPYLRKVFFSSHLINNFSVDFWLSSSVAGDISRSRRKRHAWLQRAHSCIGWDISSPKVRKLLYQRSRESWLDRGRGFAGSGLQQWRPASNALYFARWETTRCSDQILKT